ncbi:MAG TPA: HAD-IA family hydrolase [Candidatus Saccharimonadales bacterium]|nr:HAD-IA family hydrolase [Candidatus Saccharimonadales bacterium]
MKAVIFDLYGVLALNGWQAFRAKHLAHRPELLSRFTELGRQVDAGLADYNELISLVAKETGESEAAVRYQLEHTLPNEELLSYIRTNLKPYYQIGLLSNASSTKVIDQIFTAEDEMLFDVMVLSHHTGLTKPDSRMYHTVAGRLAVEAEDCLFVDDQARHVEGAIHAGMQGHVFKGVADLERYIEALG